MKKLINIWKNFWGSKFWIIENEKEIGEVLVYHHKIYFKRNKE